MLIKASPYTKTFWIEHQLNPKRTDYNIIIDQRISGKLDLHDLKSGLNRLIEHHLLFNSHLIEIEGSLYWKKNDHIESLYIHENSVDWSEIAYTPFDLENGPLYHFHISKTDTDQYDLLLVFHHAILNGILGEELRVALSGYYNDPNFYAKSASKNQLQLITETNQHLIEKTNHLHHQESKKFWQTALRKCSAKNNLPYQLSSNKITRKIRFKVDAHTLELKSIRKLKTTMFIYLATILGYTTSRFCNSEHAHISHPVSFTEGFNLMFGAQVNTVLLPIEASHEKTIKTLIQEVNTHIKNYKVDHDTNHRYLPINDIIQSSAVKSLNVSIAQTNLQPIPCDFKELNLTVLDRYPVKLGGPDILLEFAQNNEGLHFILYYDLNKLSDTFMERFQTCYKQLVSYFLQPHSMDRPLSKSPLLTLENYKIMAEKWNNTHCDYPKNQSIYSLFKHQALCYPQKKAVQLAEYHLTYEQLLTKVNQMASHLISSSPIHQDHNSDQFVALYLDRSADMIISILAILKIGKAYVPILPGSPKKRTQYILDNTNVKTLITQTHLQHELADLKVDNIYTVIMGTIKLDDTLQVSPEVPCSNLENKMAYIIYTSGTTGNPKGALTTQRSLINRLWWMKEHYNINASHNILQKTPYIFDVSVWELLLPLISGASLTFCKPAGHKDPEYLLKLLKQRNITHLHFVPSMLHVFLEYLSATGQAEKTGLNLIEVFCSGEALPSSVAAQFKSQFPNVGLHNLYGPTEVAIDATSYDNIQGNEQIIPIGKPISNIKCYVLNKGLQVVPVGVIGELYLQGPEKIWGYLNNSKENKYALIENHFANEKNSEGKTNLYKTGDLVRWLDNGNLEYIGRKDFQVKIRGYRVECSEIEHQLLQINGISQAIVIAYQPDDQKKLVAYYKPPKKETLENSYIINLLNQYLPDYMIPSYIIPLDKIPTTINGKVDYASLPKPDKKDIGNDIFQGPISIVEQKIARIWKEILKVKNIDIHHDFFDLGGDSIQSIQLVAQLKSIGFNITVTDVFSCRTIYKISKKVNHTPNNKTEVYQPFSLVSNPCIKNDKIIDCYPTTMWQQEMLLDSSHFADGTYHDVFIYHINHKLIRQKFIKVLDHLIQKHALLRASFSKNKEGSTLTSIHSTIKTHEKIEFLDILGEPEAFINQEKKVGFNHKKPGLFRVFISDQKKNSFTVTLSFHHAIADGWSIASLMTELVTAYTTGKIIEYSSKLPSFAEVVQLELKAIKSTTHKQFWKKYLHNHANHRFDYICETSQSNQVRKVVNLSPPLTSKVLSLSKSTKVPFDTLFQALYITAIGQIFDSSDITIGTIVNTRLEKEGSELLFGMHLNPLPLRQNIKQSLSLLCQNIQKDKEQILAHRHYPYHQIKKDILNKSELYSCLFNYIHFHVAEKAYSENNLEWVEAFEKMSIPLMIHIYRFKDTFKLILLGDSKFIQENLIHRIIAIMLKTLEQ
ncbi:amino acid adenylation domain-containing protein [Francisellaceae bacterium]|nr:amino acid adenylation domain-containing protein [Francisellaceae bacterium]